MSVRAVKFSLGNDKRRASGTPDYERLRELIDSSFDTATLANGYTFQYLDDEDELITIGSNSELQEAYEVANELERKTLQVSVVPYGQASTELTEAAEVAEESVAPEVAETLVEENSVETGGDGEAAVEGSAEVESADESGDDFEMVETASKFSSGEPLPPGGGDFESQATVESDSESFSVEETPLAEHGIEVAERVLEEYENDSIKIQSDDEGKSLEEVEHDEQNVAAENVSVTESAAEEDEDEYVYEEQFDEDVEEEGLKETNKGDIHIPQDSEDEKPLGEVEHDEENVVAESVSPTESEAQEETPAQQDEDEYVYEDESDEDVKEEELEEDEDAKEEELEKDEDVKEKELEDKEVTVEAHEDDIHVPQDSEGERSKEEITAQHAKEEVDDEVEELPAELIQALIDLDANDSPPPPNKSEKQEEGENVPETCSSQESETSEEHESVPAGISEVKDILFAFRNAIDEKARKEGVPTTENLINAVGGFFKAVEGITNDAKSGDATQEVYEEEQQSTTDSKKQEENTKERNTGYFSFSADGEDMTEDEFDSFLSILYPLLSEEQTVRKIQQALGEKEITQLIVSLSSLYAKGSAPSYPELMKHSFPHLPNLFLWFSRLMSSIPSLTPIAPRVASFIKTLMKRGCLSKDSSSNRRFCRKFGRRGNSFCRRQRGSFFRPHGMRSCAQEGPVEFNAEKLTHFGVFCDGCQGNSERQEKAALNGNIHAVKKYIRGTRYKSAVSEDFDLCSTCEASGDFEEEHAPFLKINTPSKAPLKITCVVLEKETRGGPRSGLRPERSQHSANSRPAVVSPGPSAQQTSETKSNAVSGEKGVVYCKQKHAMTQSRTRDQRYICDLCNSRVDVGQIVQSCRKCDFDLCPGCAAKLQRAQQPPASSPPHNPQATFVKILSLPDGSVVRPGQPLSKTWLVRNSGSYPWPLGCRMVCVGGDRMGAPLAGVDLPQTASGSSAQVKLPLRAPSQPGRYVGYWRFITTNNHRFGHRFWVDITVKGTAGQQIASQVMAPINSALDSVMSTSVRETVPDVEAGLSVYDMARLRREYSKELTQLANMGFCDIDRNARLLNEHKGCVDTVLSEIMG